ncbi:MAG: hypothetical protein AB7J35_05730 [Dehalococcoidia bacterium]
MENSVTNQPFPSGWDKERIDALAKRYEQQTDDAALAELEAALDGDEWTTVQVPTELVEAVHSLIAHFESLRASTTR